MSNQAKMERFNKWFSTNGHWMYESRDAALMQWKTFGIDGLPSFH